MLGKNRCLTRMLRSVLLLALLTLFVGCGSKGTVSGKVFYQGKPLPGGRVTFLQENGAFHSVINADGGYLVIGIAPGPATITVSSPGPPKPAASQPMERNMEQAKARKIEIPPEVAKHMGDPEAGKRRYMAIPKHYEDPDKSGLTYTVKSGSQEFDIQLK
jgi:hypothetical protein